MLEQRSILVRATFSREWGGQLVGDLNSMGLEPWSLEAEVHHHQHYMKERHALEGT